MRQLAIFLLASWCVTGQSVAPQSTIEKQRASVRKQMQSTTTSPSGFFLTPWLDAPRSDVPVPAAASATPVTQSAHAIPAGDCEPLAAAALEKLIVEACEREQVDPRLVRAMVQRESGGKPCAVSPKGAQGLMQLMHATQIDLGVRDPFEASENIGGGVRYIKQMLQRYGGNVALALAAYNAGPQRVSPGGRIPDIPETQSYVMAVLGALNEEPEPPPR